MKLLEKLLFETEAIKVACETSPFWYTSGTIGPYFINTHFLYDGEKEATNLLDIIDKSLNSPLELAKILWDKVVDFYKTNERYKSVMDTFYNELKNIDEFKNSSFVSGGERRDWFFSIVIAFLSKKEHLFIFKDLSIYTKDKKIENIGNKKVSHIADLITQASSYERAWIPAVKKIGANITFSASVVDRNQGGFDFLKSNKIYPYSSVVINEDFFKTAKINGVINDEQYNQIIEFTKDTNKFGKEFILNNVNFLKKSLVNSDNSISSKAKRCLSDNPYEINFENINIF